MGSGENELLLGLNTKMHSQPLPPAGRMILNTWGSPGMPKKQEQCQKQRYMEILHSCTSSLHKPLPCIQIQG